MSRNQCDEVAAKFRKTLSISPTISGTVLPGCEDVPVQHAVYNNVPGDTMADPFWPAIRAELAALNEDALIARLIAAGRREADSYLAALSHHGDISPEVALRVAERLLAGRPDYMPAPGAA